MSIKGDYVYRALGTMPSTQYRTLLAFIDVITIHNITVMQNESVMGVLLHKIAHGIK